MSIIVADTSPVPTVRQLLKRTNWLEIQAPLGGDLQLNARRACYAVGDGTPLNRIETMERTVTRRMSHVAAETVTFDVNGTPTTIPLALVAAALSAFIDKWATEDEIVPTPPQM